jgi:hypothetical protein
MADEVYRRLVAVPTGQTGSPRRNCMHTSSSQDTATLAGAASARQTGLGVALTLVGVLGTAVQLTGAESPLLAWPLWPILVGVLAIALIVAGFGLLLHDRTADHSTARLTAAAARLTHGAPR